MSRIVIPSPSRGARRPQLPRRRFLRGLGGLAVALPFLESLAPRQAGAQSAKPPKRFIVWYTSNGTVMRDWKPETVGKGFDASPILQPFDTPTLRPHLSVVSGIEMTSALQLGGNGHSVGMTNMLTGRPFTEVQGTEFGDVGWGGGISIDQELAKRAKVDGQLQSVELGVQTKKQYTNFYANMSYGDGGGSLNAIASDDDPRSSYQRLFANVPDASETTAELEALVAQRKSVLDFVRADFTRLQGKVSKDDQVRLDKHQELLAELESRIGVGVVCEKPTEPVFGDSDIQKAERYPDIGKAQMDLLALALSCDITRVGTMQWSSAQSGTVFESFIDANWDDVADKYHHGISHAAVGSGQSADATQQAALNKLTVINTWYAEQLAYLAGRLAEMEEADGSSVLDNTAILWVSEISEGPTHKFTDMPYVLLGGMGGALKTDEHFAFEGRSHNDLFLTMAHAMGFDDMATFGEPEYCSGPLVGLLA